MLAKVKITVHLVTMIQLLSRVAPAQVKQHVLQTMPSNT